jgi:hypothetical protein
MSLRMDQQKAGSIVKAERLEIRGSVVLIEEQSSDIPSFCQN